MFLYLTAIDQWGRSRDFRCEHREIEAVFETLNKIVAGGNKLLSARLEDDKFNSTLPIESIDGESFQKTVQQLQTEWQSALTPSPQLTSSSNAVQELIGFNNRRLIYQERHIANLNKMISRTVTLLEQAVERNALYPKSNYIIHHYESVLQFYKLQLLKAYLLRDRSVSRIEYLTDHHA